MAKEKAQSTISVADGAGGLIPVADLRFEPVEWPIQFDVSADSADHWMAQLNAECSDRGWPTHCLSQLEADENSGTIVVNAGTAGRSPSLEIIWQRPRRRSINVRARPGGTPAMSLEVANGLLAAVSDRCQAGT